MDSSPNLTVLPLEYREKMEKLQGQIKAVQYRGLAYQTPEFIEDFAYTYLYCLALLSHIRGNPAWRPLAQPWQRQLIQANLLLYPEKSSRLGDILRFFWWEVPARIWEDRLFHFISASLCLIMAVVGFFIVSNDYEMAMVFIPSALRDTHQLEAYLFSKSARVEMLSAGADMDARIKSVFAVGLAINNIKVAVMCFISGFLFGLPTVLLLIQTGLMLGTMPALFYPDDVYNLGAWLLPHGVPEVTATILAGGSGLRLGYELLSPSDEPHRLARLLKPLTGTMAVCGLMLLWAAFVESFIRQSNLSPEIRYGIALVSFLPIIALFWHGRSAYGRLQRISDDLSPRTTS